MVGTQRGAWADLEFGGVFIPKGTTITMLWLFGNRDPGAYDQPNEYRLRRDNRLWQTTFGGAGFYTCPGRHTAKLLGEVVLNALTDSAVEIVPAGEIQWKTESFEHGPLSMPVAIRRR